VNGSVGSFLLGAGAVVLLSGGAILLWMRGRAPTAKPETRAARTAELTSQIAHELKNPIMSIKGLASSGIRLHGSMSDEEHLEFFRLIDAEADRLRIVADEISTALRIDASQLTYDVREHDLGSLVRDVAWRTPVGEHAMVVEAEEELTARVDPTRFAEALTHVLDNASKFSPPDAPIEVRAYRSPHGEPLVDVIDRGPGIPVDRRQTVFGEFSEWRPAGYEHTPGAGLGLFICRAHLKAMDGRIDIVEEEKTGTMLRLTLRGG
jgi:K+-sensing histidine kinase KdpD